VDKDLENVTLLFKRSKDPISPEEKKKNLNELNEYLKNITHIYTNIRRAHIWLKLPDEVQQALRDTKGSIKRFIDLMSPWSKTSLNDGEANSSAAFTDHSSDVPELLSPNALSLSTSTIPNLTGSPAEEPAGANRILSFSELPKENLERGAVPSITATSVASDTPLPPATQNPSMASSLKQFTFISRDPEKLKKALAAQKELEDLLKRERANTV
jgi:hypothetical protein